MINPYSPPKMPKSQSHSRTRREKRGNMIRTCFPKKSSKSQKFCSKEQFINAEFSHKELHKSHIVCSDAFLNLKESEINKNLNIIYEEAKDYYDSSCYEELQSGRVSAALGVLTKLCNSKRGAIHFLHDGLSEPVCKKKIVKPIQQENHTHEPPIILPGPGGGPNGSNNQNQNRASLNGLIKSYKLPILIGGSISLVIILIVIICCCRKKCQSSAQKSAKSSSNSDQNTKFGSNSDGTSQLLQHQNSHNIMNNQSQYIRDGGHNSSLGAREPLLSQQQLAQPMQHFGAHISVSSGPGVLSPHHFDNRQSFHHSQAQSSPGSNGLLPPNYKGKKYPLGKSTDPDKEYNKIYVTGEELDKYTAMEIASECIERGETIGSGEFGMTYQGTYKYTLFSGQTILEKVCIKIPKDNQKAEQAIQECKSIGVFGG